MRGQGGCESQKSGGWVVCSPPPHLCDPHGALRVGSGKKRAGSSRNYAEGQWRKPALPSRHRSGKIVGVYIEALVCTYVRLTSTRMCTAACGVNCGVVWPVAASNVRGHGPELPTQRDTFEVPFSTQRGTVLLMCLAASYLPATRCPAVQAALRCSISAATYVDPVRRSTGASRGCQRRSTLQSQLTLVHL